MVPRARVAMVTIGQTPRPDVLPEMLSMLDQEQIDVAEVGALDGLSLQDILARAPEPDEQPMYTSAAAGQRVIVSAAFIMDRLKTVIRSLDDARFDLIVLITTGLYCDFTTRTPLIHGQHVADAWMDGLFMGACRLGVICPLELHISRIPPLGSPASDRPDQLLVSSEAESGLAGAALALGAADLIFLHSISYNEDMARQVLALAGRPVITARRLIASAIRLHLSQANRVGRHGVRPFRGPADILGHLPKPEHPLTPREQEVLTLVLSGQSNKEIARSLNISYRTVEIHRARAAGKFSVGSAADLIRLALVSHGEG